MPSVAIGRLERRAVGEPRQERVGGVGQTRTERGWTSAANDGLEPRAGRLLRNLP